MTLRRVTFVVPFLALTGGVRAFLDMADWLDRAGHEVTVVYPLWPYRFLRSRRAQLSELGARWREPAFAPWRAHGPRIRRVPLVRSRFLDDADIVIATAWPTARDVARLAPRKGRHVYLVMHHEIDSGSPADVDATYRLPMYRITISQATRRCIEGSLRLPVHAVVPCGVDPRVFHVDRPAPVREKNTVLMLYHPGPRKGATDGLHALARVRARVPRLRAILCGWQRPAKIPSWAEFVHQPSDTELRRLYNSATVLLYPSVHEGFGLPPLEAMACGCPVVTTRVGAIPEFARHEESAMVVEPGDVGAMVDDLCRVLSEPALATRLGRAGFEVADRYTLDRCGTELLAALRNALNDVPAGARGHR